MSEFNDIVVGLDIGTTKVCTVISQVRESGLEVIGMGSAPSYGLRKGVVVNIDATVESITKSVEDAEIMAGVEVESVYAGIAGNHIKGINTRGMVAISSRNREISSADVDRAIDAARTIAIPSDREIIHIFNQEFKVDDQDGVKDPVGMSGGRLEVEVHIVTGAITSSENIIKSVNRAGYKVNDIVLQSYASALACMGDEDREMGEVLVDIGGGTIDILMYINGSIWHSAVLALGGNNITNDIAIGMRVPTTFAEEIKKKHAVAFRELIRDNVEVELSAIAGKESRKCRLSDLTEITEPRMIELLGLVRKEIEMTGFSDLLAGGVILTGGGALLPGTPELAEQVLRLPTRMALPKNIGGLVDVISSPVYSTAVGLCLYGYKSNGETRIVPVVKDGEKLKNAMDKFVRWFKEYF